MWLSVLCNLINEDEVQTADFTQPILGVCFSFRPFAFSLGWIISVPRALHCPSVLGTNKCSHSITTLCVGAMRVRVAERERFTSGFVALGMCRSVVPSKQETNLGTLS